MSTSQHATDWKQSLNKACEAWVDIKSCTISGRKQYNFDFYRAPELNGRSIAVKWTHAADLRYAQHLFRWLLLALKYSTFSISLSTVYDIRLYSTKFKKKTITDFQNAFSVRKSMKFKLFFDRTVLELIISPWLFIYVSWQSLCCVIPRITVLFANTVLSGEDKILILKKNTPVEGM